MESHDQLSEIEQSLMGIGNAFEQTEEQKQKQIQDVEQAKELEKLFILDGWAHIEQLLKKIRENHRQEPSVYAAHPKLAHEHSGVLYAITLIELWIEEQKNLIKSLYDGTYAEDKERA